MRLIRTFDFWAVALCALAVFAPDLACADPIDGAHVLSWLQSVDWLVVLKDVGIAIGCAVSTAAWIAKRVSPTTWLGRLIHSVGQNGPKIQAAIIAYTPEVQAALESPEVKRVLAAYLASQKTVPPAPKTGGPAGPAGVVAGISLLFGSLASSPALACNAAQVVTTPQIGLLSSIGYHKVSAHTWGAYDAGDVSGGYGGGVGLWPDTGCTPRIILEGTMLIAAGAGSSGGSTFRASAAGLVSIRTVTVNATTGSAVYVVTGPSYDLVLLDSSGSSGLFTPFSSLGNLQYHFGGAWHF